MNHLTIYDLHRCVQLLPHKLRDHAMKHGKSVIIAGGYIRGVIAQEKPSDIDLFVGDKKTSTTHANNLRRHTDPPAYVTDNAITIKVYKAVIQFIHRWTFDTPEECVNSFDFTVCQAAFWYDADVKKWNSYCSDRFYPDLAAKRLIYTNPQREEEAGGSLLRVLKYYQKGYRVTLDGFAECITKLVWKVNMNQIRDQYQLSKVLSGLLYEVDPNGFIDHAAYLPSQEQIEGKENV